MLTMVNSNRMVPPVAPVGLDYLAGAGPRAVGQRYRRRGSRRLLGHLATPATLLTLSAAGQGKTHVLTQGGQRAPHQRRANGCRLIHVKAPRAVNIPTATNASISELGSGTALSAPRRPWDSSSGPAVK
jgi:hypothetical protein